MKPITPEILSSPLFLGGGAASFAVLLVVHLADLRAEHQETERNRGPGARFGPPFTAVRVRIGTRPIMDFCGASTNGLFSPWFLLTQILFREPLLFLPFSVAWTALLCGAPLLAGQCAGAGLAWRVGWDYLIALRHWPDRGKTVCLKLLAGCAAGVWLASLIVALVAVILTIVMALALVAAGQAGDKPRRGRRRF